MIDREWASGTIVVVNGRLGRIDRKAKSGRVHGYAVTNLDPSPDEGWLPHFTAPEQIKPAVLGQTICPTPKGSHYCGLVHVADPTQFATTDTVTTRDATPVGDRWTPGVDDAGYKDGC